MWLVLFVHGQTQTFLGNFWDASCKGRRNSEADKDAVIRSCDRRLSTEILVGAASSRAQGACDRHYHRLSTAPRWAEERGLQTLRGDAMGAVQVVWLVHRDPTVAASLKHREYLPTC